jgi:hypothetical protein
MHRVVVQRSMRLESGSRSVGGVGFGCGRTNEGLQEVASGDEFSIGE